MSTQSAQISETRKAQLRRYADPTNPDRFVQFAREVLGLRLAATQERILRAIATEKYLLIESGNGVGKTFGLGIANLATLYGRPPWLEVINFATSGTYDLLGDTLWKPMKTMHARRNLAGRTKDNPPRIEDFSETDPSFFKAISPRYPDNLEGRHSGRMLVTVEEADKPDITDEHIDSAESNITSAADRMVVVCNPPRDETNIVADLARKDKYTHLHFSSFESHNALNDYAEGDDGYIPGLVTRSKLREDWEDWNGEPWPGFEDARRQSDPDDPLFREDLDQRWYRRRAGVMPPAGASAKRPFYLSDVKAAYQHSPTDTAYRPAGIALDVARKGGDMNVLSGVFHPPGGPPYIEIIEDWEGQDHVQGEQNVRSAIDDDWDARFPVDALGEGSGLADNIHEWYPAMERFSNGTNAVQEQTYKSKWAEALAAFGDFLDDGGCIGHRKLREEALAAARVVEFTERPYQSRGTDVFTATSKDDVKEVLGRSPDYLDSAIMACWAASDETVQDTGPVEVPSAW